jgi:acyl-CoA thioesterase I
MQSITQLLQSDSPLKWVFTGDSITQGSYYTFMSRDYVQIFEERLHRELNRIRDIVIKTGVSGWTTENILNDIQWNILQFNPDIVSIMLGMNDASTLKIEDFADNYRLILETVLSKTEASIILHTPNPVTAGYDLTRSENLPGIVEQVKNLGQHYNLPVVDHWEAFNKYWEENSFRMYTWMGNGIHPNKYGHRMLAKTFFESISLWDESSLCCKFCVSP